MERGRWGGFLALGLVIVGLGGALICAPARAGIVTQADHAIVHGPGLTAAERRALTITSLTAALDPSLGLIVTVTFRGDIERYLGRGDLKNGLVALVLERKSGMPAARSGISIAADAAITYMHAAAYARLPMSCVLRWRISGVPRRGAALERDV